MPYHPEVQMPKSKYQSNDKAQMLNQAQNPNDKTDQVWHLSFWILVVIASEAWQSLR